MCSCLREIRQLFTHCSGGNRSHIDHTCDGLHTHYTHTLADLPITISVFVSWKESELVSQGSKFIVIGLSEIVQCSVLGEVLLCHPASLETHVHIHSECPKLTNAYQTCVKLQCHTSAGMQARDRLRSKMVDQALHHTGDVYERK